MVAFEWNYVETWCQGARIFQNESRSGCDY